MTTATATAYTPPASLAAAKIGDILVSVWGYSMTIVDYYQIVGRRGRTIFQIRKLQNEQVSGDPGWHGLVAPRPGAFDDNRGHMIEARMTRDGRAVSIPGFSGRQQAELWDGRNRYFNSAD